VDEIEHVIEGGDRLLDVRPAGWRHRLDLHRDVGIPPNYLRTCLGREQLP
jgi:hypothetical protein